MLEDIVKNNNINKTILLVTDNIQHYQQQFNNYNINNYTITFVNWNDISTFITNGDDTKRKSFELIIFDISISEDAKINPITTNTVEEIKKIFYNKRIFFILPSQSLKDKFLSIGICKQEDIRLQPISVFDVIDLIATTRKKERLSRLQLHDHTMYTYSSLEDKVKDAIKFLKIGIKNNETTLLLLDKDIDLFDLKSQISSSDLDINTLQDDGLLKITYSKDWYLSFNQKDNNKKNTVSVDGEKVHLKWDNLIKQSIHNGRNGLRVFSMMDCFFEYDLFDELVDYECIGSPKLNKPFLAFCAYKDLHIAQLSENQIRRLILTHSTVWI